MWSLATYRSEKLDFKWHMENWRAVSSTVKDICNGFFAIRIR